MAVDYGAFERQKGATDYNYGAQSATNAYSRFISQQRGSRNLDDMQRGFGRQTPLYKSQFNRRGLAGGGIRSGTERQAMQNYLTDYSRDYGRSQQDTTLALQGYDLQQDQLNAWRQQQMADIEAARAAAMANEAAQIEQLRAMVGGL